MFLELCDLFLLRRKKFLHLINLPHCLFPLLIPLFPLHPLAELVLLHHLRHLAHLGVHCRQLCVALEQLLLQLLIQIGLILQRLLTLGEKLVGSLKLRGQIVDLGCRILVRGLRQVELKLFAQNRRVSTLVAKRGTVSSVVRNIRFVCSLGILDQVSEYLPG